LANVLLRPSDREELCSALALASSRRERIESWDLSAVSALIDHQPADMTATVEAGMTLANLQAILARSGQWLAIDPAGAENLTIGRLLAWNLSGPRRLGYGMIRDYLIGIRVALANGKLIKAGGNVVKNVACYDLCKLFVGARDTLGLIVEATFKLRPLPEAEQVLEAACQDFAELEARRTAMTSARCDPVAFDAYRLQPEDPLMLAVAFGGTREDVAAQSTRAGALAPFVPAGFAYQEEFWARLGRVDSVSVLPSKVIEHLEKAKAPEFVARLGNGLVHVRGGVLPAPPPMPVTLMNRVKAAYDPAGIFPAYTA
jgi:FAD/FMN-containing dehydrogenase